MTLQVHFQPPFTAASFRAARAVTGPAPEKGASRDLSGRSSYAVARVSGPGAERGHGRSPSLAPALPPSPVLSPCPGTPVPRAQGPAAARLHGSRRQGQDPAGKALTSVFSADFPECHLFSASSREPSQGDRGSGDLGGPGRGRSPSTPLGCGEGTGDQVQLGPCRQRWDHQDPSGARSLTRVQPRGRAGCGRGPSPPRQPPASPCCGRSPASPRGRAPPGQAATPSLPSSSPSTPCRPRPL